MCEKCTCEQLDSFSALFTEMMKEPIKFVDMDCPIHGSQHKPKKPRKMKDKAVRKTA
jgi:hypothetical protein